MLRCFMKWYGEALDITIKIVMSLPPFTEDVEIKRLLEAAEDNKSHKKCIVRDVQLI